MTMRLFNKALIKNIDWWLVSCYIVLIFIGWMNIYASIHSTEVASIFDLAGRSGKQLVWMAASIACAAASI